VPCFLSPSWFQEKLTADMRLQFPVQHCDQIGLTYPLVNDGPPPEDPYYEVEVHASRDYVYHMSELIQPADATCECGECLEYHQKEPEVFYAARIKTACPTCRKVFDPSSLPVTVRDGWTGENSIVLGGAIYPITANKALVELCQEILGCELYEVGDIY
jgi:hypothetical protein